MESPTEVAAPPRLSYWRSSLRRAALIEAVLLALAIVALFASTGADNPLGFILAGMLQFPVSLLFVPILDHLPHCDSVDSLVMPGAIVALLQFGLIAVVCEFSRRRSG